MYTTKYLFSVLLLLCAPLSFALGLGEATLHSTLNQPLLVRIPILGAQDLTKTELKVKIASEASFAQQKLERSYIHSLLKTRIKRVPNSGFVIEVYTQQPFKDAWINFLLDFRWPKGNIIKNVNLLLDLPER